MPEQEKEPEKQPKPESAEATGPEKAAGGEAEKKTGTHPHAHPHATPGTKHHAGERTKRHKKAPKGMLIGMVAGGVAIVAVIVVLASGGGMPKEDLEAAKNSLRSVLQHCLEGNAESAIPQIDAREILKYEKPDEVRKWKDLSADQIAGLSKTAFRNVQDTVGKIGIKDMAGADALIAAAKVTPNAAIERVQYEMKVGDTTWNAAVMKQGGAWRLVRLEIVK